MEVMIFVFCICRFSFFNIPNIDKGNEYVVSEKYDNYVILEREYIRYLYYDENLNKGNKVIIIGNVSLLQDGAFNDYLRSQRVNYLVKGDVICNNNYLSFNEQVINKLLEKKDAENKEYLQLILFNRGKSENYFYSLFEIFSISFLVVISGFHINLIFKLLEKTKGLKYIICIFYLYLLNFSVSSLKAFLYYVLKKISKKNELILNNSDLLSLIMISLLFFNPSYCFNKGFIYSFAFSYIIDFINNIIVKKGLKYKILKKSLIFLFSLPIILINSYSVNSSAYLASLILGYPISFLFIFSLIYLIFDKFYLVYKLYIYLLKLLLEFLKVLSIDLVFGKPSYLIIILMYASIILFLYFYQNMLKSKYMFCIGMYFIICIFQYTLPYLDFREQVYFINVGQGDCSVLKIRNSKKVVMIDTGGNRYKDLATSTIIPFLKSKGINKIEKLVVSHDDFDHNGSKESLIRNFNVEEVIEDSFVKEIVVGDSIFVNVNQNEYRDNDGSIVLYGNYGGIDYLFSGDISSNKEKEIINKYELSVDVLKISHHGANSSSSEEFLNKIHPLIGVIGVSKNNKYGHPSSEVIDRLESFNVKIYRTDKDNNIIIYKSLISERIIIERD